VTVTEQRPDAQQEAEPAADTVEVLSIEEILEQKQPDTETVTVDLGDDRTATFRFRGIGRLAWRRLLDEHPATDEQQQQHRAAQLERGVMPSQVTKLGWNADTFPPAAIAATCVEPKITEAQARKLWDSPAWNDGELDKLFSAVLLVNQSDRRVSLGKGYEAILASMLNSVPPTTT